MGELQTELSAQVNLLRDHVKAKRAVHTAHVFVSASITDLTYEWHHLNPANVCAQSATVAKSNERPVQCPHVSHSPCSRPCQVCGVDFKRRQS